MVSITKTVIQLVPHTPFMGMMSSTVNLTNFLSKTELGNYLIHVLLYTFIVRQKVNQVLIIAIKLVVGNICFICYSTCESGCLINIKTTTTIATLLKGTFPSN